jgi:hypothetical protein
MPLSGFISHYWLSLGNTDSTHTVFPDGAVGLVIKVCGNSDLSSVRAAMSLFYKTCRRLAGRMSIPDEPL